MRYKYLITDNEFYFEIEKGEVKVKVEIDSPFTGFCWYNVEELDRWIKSFSINKIQEFYLEQLRSIKQNLINHKEFLKDQNWKDISELKNENGRAGYFIRDLIGFKLPREALEVIYESDWGNHIEALSLAPLTKESLPVLAKLENSKEDNILRANSNLNIKQKLYRSVSPSELVKLLKELQ
jgi:hypothetical protein